MYYKIKATTYEDLERFANKSSNFNYQDLKEYLVPFINKSFLESVISQGKILTHINAAINANPKLTRLSREEKIHLIISLLLEYHYIQFNKNNFTSIDLLKNYAGSDKLVSSIKERQRLPNRSKKFQSCINLVKGLTILQPDQIKDYLNFCNKRTFPLYVEDFLSSDVFFALYKQIGQEQREEFLEEILLMNKWFLFSERLIEDQDLTSSERELFEKVIELQNIIPKLRAEYFLKNKNILIKNEIATLANKRYTLKHFPKTEFNIEDLFSFINSDNVSFFKTFDYNNFHSTKYPFVRAYDGMPLSVLHGTNAAELIAQAGHLKKAINNKTYGFANQNSRNKQYIFFGSLWDHFCRTPACREVDKLFRFYGETVIEFPIKSINIETNKRWPLRGNFLQTFISNSHKDPEGHAIPFDIYETDRAQLPLKEAVRIYCETEEQFQFWQKQKAEQNLSFEIHHFDEARTIAKAIHEEAKTIIENFQNKNNRLFETLSTEHTKLYTYLKVGCANILENTAKENKEYLSLFIKQYSCLTFSDFQ